MIQPIIKVTFFLVCALVQTYAVAQQVGTKLSSAFDAFQEDPQLRHAISSLYVLDARTGQVVFERNGRVGLAPASTQKVITSVSAYEILGEDFKFKTTFAYYNRDGETSLQILPGGDPTFGSWRWSTTKEDVVLKNIAQALQQAGIHSLRSVVVDNEGWNEETIPGGWIWQDIGNYYGAGAAKLNWRENQFDVLLKSGKQIGDPVSIVRMVPEIKGYTLRSEVTSAAAGSGDNAYIYFPLNASVGTIRGTIPINQEKFKISGTIPSASDQFVNTLQDHLAGIGIQSPGIVFARHTPGTSGNNYQVLHTVVSPPLGEIIYWFNRKSINLYGEALMKTMGYQQKETGSTDAGTTVVKNFWNKKGIAEAELDIVDGSGLSPLNRVTTHAQAAILHYAKSQPWFRSFHAFLPEYNGMKMKSGTIRGVKGYCGYHQAKDGKEYVFSFIVNNYNGSSGALVQKMYKVLNELK